MTLRFRVSSGSIPARAGEPSAGHGLRSSLRVYPRPCGGADPTPVRSVPNDGLSPPVRGSPGRVGLDPILERSIPARAGEPHPRCSGPPPRRVYPRPCGGAASARKHAMQEVGLSPPVRGSRGHRQPKPVRGRSIPARAGEPAAKAVGYEPGGVYPRPCGGAAVGLDVPGAGGGLSPPVRGSREHGPGRHGDRRSIPARAGEPTDGPCPIRTRRVYPRPCGGAVFCNASAARIAGLSPPVRGSHFAITHYAEKSGSIPARAGEPLCQTVWFRCTWVYPRPCGGALIWPPIMPSRAGLSPPVRGSLREPGRPSPSWRSIPARAGEPGTSKVVEPNGRVYPRPCGGARLPSS